MGGLCFGGSYARGRIMVLFSLSCNWCQAVGAFHWLMGCATVAAVGFEPHGNAELRLMNSRGSLQLLQSELAIWLHQPALMPIFTLLYCNLRSQDTFPDHYTTPALCSLPISILFAIPITASRSPLDAGSLGLMKTSFPTWMFLASQWMAERYGS